MRFAVEAWAPEYGIAVDGLQLDEASEPVDINVECRADDWAPVSVPDQPSPASMVFIDGIRRIDARIWIDDDGIARPGVCASVAAGAVVCTATQAKVVETEVHHGLYADAASGADDIHTSKGTYFFVPCSGDQPEDIYLGMHNRMTALEATIAAGNDADVVVYDGPLRGRETGNGVGFIKTQHVQYLPDEQQRVLGKLTAGQRTPVFHIGGRFSKWSWYVRLPGPVPQPLAGIVRCELPGLGPAEEAIRRSGSITSALQRYASEPHKDSRAPQNLYPIAGLENDLRRRLGDQKLLERALRVAAK